MSLKFSESIGNPVWVAQHVRELREMFPLTTQRPLMIGDILRTTAALGALGIDPSEFETVWMSFASDVLYPLQNAGICTVQDLGMRGLIVTRKPVAAFEIAATQLHVEKLVEQEPTAESREIADGFLSKLLSKP
jgi:hypothetical protein